MLRIISGVLLLPFLVYGCSKQHQSNVQTPTKIKDSNSIHWTSTHHEHLEKFNSKNLTQSHEWDSLHGITHSLTPDLQHSRHSDYKVFGWHPHYMGSSYLSYNYNLLWGIGYFCYRVNPLTGSYTSVYDWKTTDLIDSAKKAGTKVLLTTALFGRKNNRVFLNNKQAQGVFVSSIVALLKEREADGIVIDFEDVPSDCRDKFTRFLQFVSKELKQANSDYIVSMTLPGIERPKTFDISALNEDVDLFLMMGYDYHYSRSKIAGPVSPLTSGNIWSGGNLETSVQAYLNNGMSKKKLILALPYYGRKWKTKDLSVGSANLRYLSSPLYHNVRRINNLNTAVLDSVSATKYLVSQSERHGTATQLWYDDQQTLGIKYDWIIEQDLGGVGIWALGYDNGYNDLWKLLGKKFGTH